MECETCLQKNVCTKDPRVAEATCYINEADFGTCPACGWLRNSIMAEGSPCPICLTLEGMPDGKKKSSILAKIQQQQTILLAR